MTHNKPRQKTIEKYFATLMIIKNKGKEECVTAICVRMNVSKTLYKAIRVLGWYDLEKGWIGPDKLTEEHAEEATNLVMNWVRESKVRCDKRRDEESRQLTIGPRNDDEPETDDHDIFNVSEHDQTVWTMRDQFAASALNGLLSSHSAPYESLAEIAYSIADSMLEARR